MTDSTLESADQRITVRHVFDAPPEVVFSAWTDPDQVARWFGPSGWEAPRESVEIDPRVGGAFSLRMVKPGSEMEYWLRYEIVELQAPDLLVLKSEPMPQMGLHQSMITRIEFEADGDRTRMTLTDGPFPEEGGRGAGAAWKAAFEKLEQVVAAG